MALADSQVIVNDFERVSAGQLYVTPTGGSQLQLAALLGGLVLLVPGIASGLPTSNAGLVTGSLWNNAGVLSIA